MKQSKKLILKLDAPLVYSALDELAGIDQELINLALDGSPEAISQIADFKLRQQTRESNATEIFSNLKDGVTSMSNVIKQESDFINHTSNEISTIANNWSQVRLSDRTLGHNLEQSLIRSDNQLIEADYKHSRKINLLATEHQTNMQLIDVEIASNQHQLHNNVRQRIGSESLAVKGVLSFQAAKMHGSKIGSGLKTAYNLVKKLFD